MPTTYCRHIRPSGRRCQSPALRTGPFCFYHQTINSRHRSLHPPDDGSRNVLTAPDYLSDEDFKREPVLAEYYANTRAPIELDFPALEDHDSIQTALSMLVSALGQGRLDLKRASPILYALQIASSNARHITSMSSRHSVTETLLDHRGSILAPDEDPEEV